MPEREIVERPDNNLHFAADGKVYVSKKLYGVVSIEAFAMANPDKDLFWRDINHEIVLLADEMKNLALREWEAQHGTA